MVEKDSDKPIERGNNKGFTRAEQERGSVRMEQSGRFPGGGGTETRSAG